MLAGGAVELHEVKGFWREAAKVRVKVCAELYPFWPLRIVRPDGQGWSVESL